MSWGAIAGAAIGAVGSMAAADSAESAAESSKNPWSGAEPWIMDNIATGQELQRYYQQNPFNALQMRGMNQQVADYDNYRNVVMPGLLGFANRLMGTNYSRNGAPVGMQGGLMGGMQGGFSPMLQQVNPGQAPMTQGGPFPAVAPAGAGGGGGLDFNGMNPLYVDPSTVPETVPDETANAFDEMYAEWADERDTRRRNSPNSVEFERGSSADQFNEWLDQRRKWLGRGGAEDDKPVYNWMRGGY